MASSRSPGRALEAVRAEGATIELLAPTIGGIVASDRTLVPANTRWMMVHPFLFAAVTVLPSLEGVALPSTLPPAHHFIADAYAQYKFVGLSSRRIALFAKGRSSA
jgi:catalase